MEKTIPESVRTMLQTMKVVTNKESKEYAIHQARTLRTGKETNSRPAADLVLNESEDENNRWHSKTDSTQAKRRHPKAGRFGCRKGEN